MLTFACLSPHAPIFLPEVGSPADRQKVKTTINSLESLAPKLASPPTGGKPEIIFISSPHPDWGVNVPARFLLAQIQNLKFKIQNYQFANEVSVTDEPYRLYPILTTQESPKNHYQFGKLLARKMPLGRSIAWIASGDMSHVLKKDGPYGFHPAGPKFDQKFIELLKKKKIDEILNLDQEFVEQAAVCGIWSFCLLFGVLDGLKVNWEPEVLSYEGPFGIGYLVADIRMDANVNSANG